MDGARPPIRQLALNSVRQGRNNAPEPQLVRWSVQIEASHTRAKGADSTASKAPARHFYGEQRMRIAAVSFIGALLLVSCTTVAYDGPGLEPIPGSIIYRGQPHTKLTKSPIGSTFPHDLRL